MQNPWLLPVPLCLAAGLEREGSIGNLFHLVEDNQPFSFVVLEYGQSSRQSRLREDDYFHLGRLTGCTPDLTLALAQLLHRCTLAWIAGTPPEPKLSADRCSTNRRHEIAGLFVFSDFHTAAEHISEKAVAPVFKVLCFPRDGFRRRCGRRSHRASSQVPRTAKPNPSRRSCTSSLTQANQVSSHQRRRSSLVPSNSRK